MPSKLPSANLNGRGSTKRYTDSQLINRAQQIHDAMLANVATFASPQPTMIALQTLINNYQNATVAAIKGTKLQTAAKATAKKALLLALKQEQQYVNQVAQVILTPQNKTLIPAVKRIILLSGFAVSDTSNPVEAGSGLNIPIIRRAKSEMAGSIKILVRQYTAAKKNTLLWQVNYRTSAIPGTPVTPAGPWLTQTFTGQNQILLEGLTSGISYDYQIAAIGGRDTQRNQDKPINFTPISSIVVI